MAELLTDTPLDELLPSVPLFGGLDPDALADVRRTTEAFSLAAGEMLFAQNDSGDGAYLIGSGRISVFGRTPGDGLRLLTTVGPAHVIGEFCLLDGGRRSAEARAEEDTRGYRIDAEKFAALRAGGRPAAFTILRRLQAQVASRTRSSIDEIARLAPPTSPSPARAPRRGGTTADPAECKALLQTFPGFDRFRDDDWLEFAGLSEKHDLARGEMLESGGSPWRALYCVARGALRTRLPDETGGPQLVVQGPGALVGAAAMVHAGDWPASLEAREHAIVYLLPASVVTGIITARSSLGERLFDMLGLHLVSDLRRISRVHTRLDLLGSLG